VSARVRDTTQGVYIQMKTSYVISMYIEQAWEKCKRAKTCDETDQYSEKIDTLYDILGVVSKFERSLLVQNDID
jgi:hypothetical protein